MKDTNIFQMAVLGFFVVVIVIGMIVVATVRGGPSEGGFASEVVVWGTSDDSTIETVFLTIRTLLGEDGFNVVYEEKNPSTFDAELLEALATGTGPDVLFLPQSTTLRHENKLFPIPFESFSERTFRDLFIEEGELYLHPDGILALPIMVDPMVMYWNKDILSSAGIARPPSSWDEFYTLGRDLTVRDAARNITKSAVALGEFKNISHAKEVFSGLILQAGGTPTTRNSIGRVLATLNRPSTGLVNPTESALGFYIDFANPSQPFYSWNSALPESKDMFLAGDLATYFGFASELGELRTKNPNLNFDVTFFPQTVDAKKRVTFGRMHGLAILKSSQNIADAFRTIVILSGSQAVTEMGVHTGLPPVRRDLLEAVPSDAYQSIFYESALIARGWLDPDPAGSNEILRAMVESSSSGRTSIRDAIGRANDELNALLE